MYSSWDTTGVTALSQLQDTCPPFCLQAGIASAGFSHLEVKAKAAPGDTGRTYRDPATDGRFELKSGFDLKAL